MKIHSNLPEHEFINALNDARRASGTIFERHDLSGSRTHARKIDVILSGESGRKTNQRWYSGEGVEAATWDQWGIFLAVLYEADPTIVCGSVKYPYYSSAEDYHTKTGGRFERCAQGDAVVLSQTSPDYKITAHRWEYDYETSRAWSGQRRYYCKGHSAKRNPRPECHATRVI